HVTRRREALRRWATREKGRERLAPPSGPVGTFVALRGGKPRVLPLVPIHHTRPRTGAGDAPLATRQGRRLGSGRRRTSRGTARAAVSGLLGDLRVLRQKSRVAARDARPCRGGDPHSAPTGRRPSRSDLLPDRPARGPAADGNEDRFLFPQRLREVQTAARGVRVGSKMDRRPGCLPLPRYRLSWRRAGAREPLHLFFGRI